MLKAIPSFDSFPGSSPASHSGVLPGTTQRIEKGAELPRITMQVLAYAMEVEGLVFFPGHPPLRSGNCRGATPHPRTRDDHHLIE